MSDYPLDKYQFYFTNNKVIAVSTYEGKTVRGVAKCDPRDTFDPISGKMLAAARCNQKIAHKRKRRADKEYRKATIDFDKARCRMEAMTIYYEDARRAEKEADLGVKSLLSIM